MVQTPNQFEANKEKKNKRKREWKRKEEGSSSAQPASTGPASPTSPPTLPLAHAAHEANPASPRHMPSCTASPRHDAPEPHPLPTGPHASATPATGSSSSPRQPLLPIEPRPQSRRGPRVTQIACPCSLGAAPTQPLRHQPRTPGPSDAPHASPSPDRRLPLEPLERGYKSQRS